MQYNYTEIVTGGVQNRGNIIELPSNISNIDLDYFGKTAIDSFHSVFLHSKDYLIYSDIHGGKKGYNGSVFSKCLFWDLDNINIDNARKDTIELVERLIKFNYKNIKIYFSGNKGFHVIYLCPELKQFVGDLNFNQKVKNICIVLAKGLNSFDDRIYDKTRIFRTLNSLHSKTNLYKIELTYDDLNSLTKEELFELASKQKKSNKIVYDDNYNEDIIRLLNNSITEETTVKRGAFDAGEIITGIRYGFKCGNRNSGFATIAGMLHRRNIDSDFIEAILHSINSNSENPIQESEITTIVNSINRYPIDSNYIETENEDILNIQQAGNAWYDLIQKSGYTNFGERFLHLNERMKLCIPGDAIAIVANTGVGKSTIGLELGNNEALARNMYSLIASLEMSRAGIFFRAATIEATDLSIDNYVPSSDVASTLLKSTVLRDKVYKTWKSLKIVDKGGLSLDKIIEYFQSAQLKFENQIGNLVIDYAQNIKDSEKIDYAMMMARRFKEVAKGLNTKLFVLMQCNKTVPDDYTEVQKNYIEGAGAYVQAMDYIIAAWRSRDQNNRLHCKFLKDRWGSSDYKFDLVREGLKYHTENYIPDRPSGGI